VPSEAPGGPLTRLGFLIDQDTCIGCHACTVACKSEHDVPLGVNRTWVKYIETGSFPNVARQFSVMRCNHCEDAPCVEICPTSALFHRANGIVDFDTSNCIGCKSCMNACPYDALYIDPEEQTAQKCNMCAHRIDQDLEPSCVVVCPTQSILVGDLDDPTTRISRLVARADVAVRSPEQGTRPKLFYKGADQAALDPTRSAIAADGMIWAETTAGHPTPPVPDAGHEVARTAYTTAHPAPWGMMVSAYLVTKAIGAGAMIVAALLVALGWSAEQAAVGVMPPVVAGAFTALTGLLLVADLKQPQRFYYLLTRPNWTSWLVKGAVALGLYAAVSAAWFGAGLAAAGGALEILALPAALLGATVAGYTAFLFAQCEGRDLWQTPLLLPMLLAQAVAAGGAVFAVADLFMAVPQPTAVRWALLGGLLAHLVLIALEVTSKGTRHVEMATAAMVRGPYARLFWAGIVAAVVAAMLAGLAIGGGDGATALAAAAALLAIAAVALYEDAFVRAGQSVPLS
jgi:Fe-S-cluster-containing dehydrogenase component/formate-dependent nitrite reductase membrane component NrfD